MAVSSINFQKSSEHSYDHNFRYDSPNYLLEEEDRLENSYWKNDLSAKEIFNNELSRSNRRGGRIPKFENSHWEAVLNLNKEHTLDDVKKVADYLENKLNITCATIAVHRDEGHYKNGKAYYNFHAHLTFVTYKDGRQNWRKEKIKPQTLGEIQTEVAKILKMERGQENSKKTRLSAKQYKKVAQELEAKDQTIQKLIQNQDQAIQELIQDQDQTIQELIQTQDQEIQKLEEELEEEKLSKAKLKAELEELRKNSKNQGFSKEYFQEINKEKKLLRFKTLNEFKKWVEELREKHTKKNLLSNKVNEEAVLKDMYKVYQEQDNTIQAQNAKIKDLEAKNETLKAENELWNEAIKTNLALKKAWDCVLEALKNKPKTKGELYSEGKKRQKVMLDKIENIDDLGINNIFKKVDKTEVKEQDQEQKNEVIQTQNQEKTPNNEELTENNGKQATHFLNNFFKDDVSIFSKTNTDKTEISEEDQEQEEYQEQNQTHNQTKKRKNT